MNETESLSAVAEYLKTLGYPDDTLHNRVQVGGRGQIHLVVKVGERFLITVGAKESDFDIDALLKAELFHNNKTVTALQKAAKSINAEYYILSNGVKHLWFINDNWEKPSLINEVPFSAFNPNFPSPTQAIEVSFKELFASFNHNFYIAGGLWENDNEFQRLVPYSAWQEDSKYLKEIESVGRGDLIIFRSNKYDTIPTVMSIRGMGRVLNNDFPNKQLEIDWQRHVIQVDIRRIIYSYELFSKINRDDIFRLFENIGIESIRNSGILEPLPFDSRNPGPNTASVAPPPNFTGKIPGLLSDSEVGLDYLDIAKDVLAFARLIAAKSFQPPLAIALLGKWGSGKSFFMRNLKERIEMMSLNEDDIYCKGIAHIHFNAWSYLDASLWASLVTKIFEGLHQYISQDSEAKKYKKEIEKTLTKQLNIAQEEVGILEVQKSSLARQIKELSRQKSKAENQLNQKIQKIQANTIKKVFAQVDQNFRVKEKIEEALTNNKTFIETADELKRIVPDKYWESPTELYKKTKSSIAFIKDFFRGRKCLVNCGWLVGIIIIVFCIPPIITGAAHFLTKKDLSFSTQTWYAVSITGALLTRGIESYRRLQPLIASFWKIKVDYEREKLIASSEFKQYDKALRLQIEKTTNDIVVINQHLSQAIEIQAGLQFKIENALSTQALYSFIEKRSSSEDYQKYLGIVSVIRKDFEILSELFSEHQSELVNVVDKKRFLSYFDRPLERIVLYVDDLDRCPEETVVHVLEAVNLLMAFPLFVVVVGVDSRWVRNALIKKHRMQFESSIQGKDQMESEIDLIEPSNYLEKIFQIPFHLKDAKESDVKKMIRGLALCDNKDLNDITVHSGEESDAIAGLIRVLDENTPIDESLKVTNENVQSHHLYNDPVAVEGLRLSERDVELMENMSDIIGNNPRSIKRFVNIFRIIKVHDEFSYDVLNEERELLVVLFLIALSLGRFKKLIPSFEHFLDDSENLTKALYHYLQPSTILVGENLNVLRHNLDLSLSGNKNYPILQHATVNRLYRHNGFIKRFTFKNL